MDNMTVAFRDRKGNLFNSPAEALGSDAKEEIKNATEGDGFNSWERRYHTSNVLMDPVCGRKVLRIAQKYYDDLDYMNNRERM
jgi:hypothetical protein